MIPLRIENANLILTAPPGQEETCRDLHVLIEQGCCISRWEPTPAELAILNAGGSVELWVQGHGMPPVFLRAEPLHEDLEEPALSLLAAMRRWLRVHRLWGRLAAGRI